jgi:A nuclease family of the HNH/ENDO VII superfamily with conserved AHH
VQQRVELKMPTFRTMRSKKPVEGFNLHHLVPNQIIRSSSFSDFFEKLYFIGFDPNDFATNGMYLPVIESNAAAFQLPLHRGPHPKYNGLVAEHVSMLTRLAPDKALSSIYALQNDLRAALRFSQDTGIPLLRNPMNNLLEHDLGVIGILGDERCRTTRIP